MKLTEKERSHAVERFRRFLEDQDEGRFSFGSSRTAADIAGTDILGWVIDVSLRFVKKEQP